MPRAHRAKLLQRLLPVLLVLLAPPAQALTKVKFSLDWLLQGPNSPFLVAVDKGYYQAEGLDVSVDPGNGSVSALSRVAGGAYQMGFADLNALIEFNAQNPDKAVLAVMMVYDVPPFSVFTLKKSGIASPKQLEGRTLGAPVFDASFRLFPIFAKKIGIDERKVARKNMEPALREALLLRGDVDAISGHFFTSLLDLKARGAAPSDIVSFLYSDYGLDLYGNAVIASSAMIKENPKAVAGFIRATLRAFRDVAADPALGVAAAKKRDPLLDEALELERLKLALKTNILTPAVKANGMGGVDPKRLRRSIAQVAEAIGLRKKPAPESVFSSAFLQPKAERRIR